MKYIGTPRFITCVRQKVFGQMYTSRSPIWSLSPPPLRPLQVEGGKRGPIWGGERERGEEGKAVVWVTSAPDHLYVPGL